MNKREKMYLNIERHGEQLNAIFHTGLDPVKLCKKLHRLEIKGNAIATHGCNGTIADADYERESDAILDQVDKVLQFRKQRIPVFFNADARGYTLKIKSEYLAGRDNSRFHQDMGGYGIIAPDFTA